MSRAVVTWVGGKPDQHNCADPVIGKWTIMESEFQIHAYEKNTSRKMAFFLVISQKHLLYL